MVDFLNHLIVLEKVECNFEPAVENQIKGVHHLLKFVTAEDLRVDDLSDGYEKP